MTIGTLLYTKLFGHKVGTDPFGNTYYQAKALRAGLRRKRWVIYRGAPEASAVPPEWHAWLHYTIDAVPENAGRPHAPWQKPHEPNRTGSSAAYRPPGHTLEGGKRAKGTGDYQAWTPS
ncbi:MAG: NADH:ubiquinone oxidoreductase subunit NDUFA12 [Rhodospirillales bacterium]